MDDDLEAKRLGDYSEAILRGDPADPRGIDPRDAALIEELHALGRSSVPSPAFFGRARQIPARDAMPTSDEASRALPTGDRRRIADDDARTAAPPLRWRRRRSSPREGVAPIGHLPAPPLAHAVPVGAARPHRRWMAAIIGLVLLVTTATVAYFSLSDDEANQRLAPATAWVIVVPTTFATPAPTSTAVATPISPPVTAPPAPVTAPPRSENYLIYEAFTEPSSVGPDLPVSESFRPTTIAVPWDGEGVIILSGCPDRACDLVIDDRLYIQVTNEEQAEEGLWIVDNGAANTLPVVLTDRFRPGTNQVRVALLDEQGDQRGVLTPVYIVILR